MVHFIYGRTGSGKSTFMLECASATHGKHIFVLVPDRGAVMAERTFSYAPNAGDIDVVTFSRLSNYVFRKYGGICENYISRGAKKVIMHNTLSALSGLFSSKGEFFESDTAATERFIGMRTELARGAVTPELLAGAAEACEGEAGKKFADISMLFTAFDAEVGARFEDPDGMPAKTNALLAENDFFRGSDVYIDGFNSFSKEQLATVREIMRGADEVYISVPYVPEEDKNTSCFFGISDTEKRLLDTVRDAGAKLAEPTVLLAGRRFRNEELSFLSRNLFPGNGFVKGTYEEEPKYVRVMSAANCFAEAEAVCLDIAKKVREGARYRDFAVIVRSTESYTGIIDAMMRKYEIPCFISGRRDITELAFIKFLLSALAAAERGWARELIISYIKTDFAGLTPDEINLFENYVRKWNINGARFYDDYEWNMNPDGFRGEMTEENAEKLLLLAEIRKKTVLPLRAFCEDTAGRHSVEWFSERLYTFARSLAAPEKIALDAAKAAERGEKSLAAELSQLFGVFCGALDALVSACGSEVVSLSEFTALLRLVLSETDIGKIPTSLDEVAVFDAQAGGYAGVKHAYIMGACEGVFPARVEDDGVFSDKEKELLLAHGIEITSTVERRLCDELYYFYTAACAAAESLCFTYPVYDGGGKKTRLSPALKSVKELFPKLSEERFESLPKEALLERASASFEYILHGNGAYARALREYYENAPEYAEKTRYIGTPLSAHVCRIPEEDARALFPKNMSTSYSRLERYIVCNFSYFCEYELKLKDNLPARFGAVDVGNFMHRMLEITVRYALHNPDATEEEMREQIEKECRLYLEAVCRGSYAEISPRIAHLASYLSLSCEKFVKKFREEFRESRFTPKDFEITVGKGADIEPIRLTGENGSVELRGKIDRVDVYEGGEGKIYIRVADYKTGSKKFQLENIEAGRDLQMLLYLYSVCENGERRYGKGIAPAGVLYVSVKPASDLVDLGAEKSKDENGNSGLFLDDEEVLTAMEPKLEGRFIPVTKGKGGKKKGNLIAAEEFSALKETVVETVLRASEEMRGGKADADPCDESVCEYCKMKAVCRTKKK